MIHYHQQLEETLDIHGNRRDSFMNKNNNNIISIQQLFSLIVDLIDLALILINIILSFSIQFVVGHVIRMTFRLYRTIH